MSIFQALFNQKQAFVAYLTAGHRGLDYTEQAAHALIRGGVDILEIGLPFSDPIADGPVIQDAMLDALARGTELSAVLETIARIKQHTNTPIVLFSYYNPLLACGLNHTLKQAALAGVDAILIVDLPLEESHEYLKLCRAHQLKPIGLLSPSSSQTRIQAISAAFDGFLYYVCRHGTTGIKNSLPDNYAHNLKTIRTQTKTPVVSGFGISTQTLATEALQHADGFVVGSAFVQAISNGASPRDLQTLATHIKPRRIT
jgi:tryptophan synthase alpha chain